MKKLVLTMAAGRYQEIKDIIYPLFEHYAAKCGADFASIEDIKHSECPVLDKLRLTDYFSDYDRLLFLDADILVRKDTPNLFDLVPVGKMACYDEGSTLMYPPDLQLRMHHVNLLVEQWGLAPVQWPTTIHPGEVLPYYNSGVILLDAEHEYLFQKPPVDPITKPKIPCGEQVWMNWGIRTYRPKMHHLPLCFNQMPYNRCRDYLRTCYMCHYAGYEFFDDRARDMRKEHAIWQSIGYI